MAERPPHVTRPPHRSARDPRAGDAAGVNSAVVDAAVVVERARPPQSARAQGTVVPRESSRPADGPSWARVEPRSRGTGEVTHRVHERITEKRRIEQRHRMSVGARRLVYFALAAGGAWLALLSPVFALDAAKVEVSGTGVIVDPALVAATVAPYEGRSLAVLNVAHLSNQLGDLPGVREAKVERVWPAGLRVTITTRVPVAAIPDPAGGFVLLDDAAVHVGTVAAVPADVPVVTIPLGEGNERILDAVIAVINELPADVRARVGGVSAQTEDSVTFALRDGPRVEWGGVEQSALKAHVLEVLLQSPQAQTAAVIDVSAPTLPITRAD